MKVVKEKIGSKTCINTVFKKKKILKKQNGDAKEKKNLKKKNGNGKGKKIFKEKSEKMKEKKGSKKNKVIDGSFNNNTDDSDDELLTFKEKDYDEMEEQDSDSGDSYLDPEEHKKSLQRLKESDPKFYSFLKQNDKELLDFDVSDDEGESLEADDSIHVPDNQLEVASDESDFEHEDEESSIKSEGPMKITLKLLKKWQEDIQTDKTAKTIKYAVQAFHAALETVEDSAENKTSLFKVDGTTVFNGVVQLCVMHLPDAFRKFLKLGSNVEAHKAKRFAKVKGVLRSYLADLIKILQNVSSVHVLTVLLKHVHQMLPFTVSFSSLRKPLLRVLLKFWSTGEETVRVIAFLCILRIARTNESTLDTLLKTMYIKYVENSKFVSPNTLPGINFMRHSLIELYLLDGNFAYRHAFLYIRQLAIQLRNAITLKKKENFQAVYNWQFINSLRFWSELLGSTKKQCMLRQLIHPLVQITTGTIKLIPTAQYYPLRFHCIETLINLSRESNVFIPILPFLLEILSTYDFNKKHKSVSMKPISFICLLRMSKSQLQENGFKDSVIENLYLYILQNAEKDSHTVYFPDLYIPCIIQLKEFIKKCHVAAFAKKMKQLVDKIEENRKFIESERSKTTLDLKNIKGIENWENRIKTEGTPLSKFYKTWYTVYESQKLKILTQNDSEADYKLPSVMKSRKRRDGDESGDSDLDMPVEEVEKMAKKLKKKRTKIVKGKDDDDVDLPTNDTDTVHNLKLDDWD